MSRVEAARRKLRITRYAIGITAAAALAAFAAAARASHPATHASTPTRQAAVTQAAQQSESDDGFYSIGPSGSAAPQVQSGGS